MNTLKSMSASLILEKNKVNSIYPYVLLLSITLDGTPSIFLARDTQDVTYNGQLYTAFPFEVDANKSSSSGEIPTLTIRVCNVNRVIQAYLEDYDGLVDETVTLIIVNTHYLSEDYSDFTFDFTVLGCTADAMWASFTLGAPNLLNRRFPLYRYMTSFCRYVSHYKGVECKYSGGEPSGETTCNGTLESCKKRGNAINFGGFPGLQKGNLRLA